MNCIKFILPFYHAGIEKFVIIDEPFPYLEVAEGRQYFAVTTSYMLAKCTQELYTVCPSDLVLKTASEPNCLIASFLGKTDVMFTKCKRLVINETFEPIWISLPDATYWIYGLSTPRVTAMSRDRDSSHRWI